MFETTNQSIMWSIFVEKKDLEKSKRIGVTMKLFQMIQKCFSHPQPCVGCFFFARNHAAAHGYGPAGHQTAAQDVEACALGVTLRVTSWSYESSVI